MRTDLPDHRERDFTRRGFLGRVGAAGFAAAGARSALEAFGAQPSGGAMHVIADVRLRGRPGLWNVGIEDGRIRRISQQPIAGSNVIFGGGRLLTEGLVEHHFHLDKTLTADRVRWDEAGLAADERKFDEEVAAGRWIRHFTIFRESLIKATFTEDDVFERACRMAKMMSANGTTAIRSHAVVEAVRDLKCVRGLLRARDAMRPYMDLQIVVFPQDDHLLRTPHTVDLIRRGMKEGADAGATMGVGGLPELDWDRADEYLDLVFRLAKEHGGFVDTHTDQARSSRPDDRMLSHPIMVAKARKYGLQGQVTASHSHSLDFRPLERVLPVLDEMRETGIHLSCAPSSSPAPGRPGRVQLARSRGVLASLHNDNVRDPLSRGGRADLVEQAALYCRLAGIGPSDEALEPVFDLITTCPGRALGLPDYGLHEGGAADLVLFDAQSVAEVLLHQARPALVFKRGDVVAQAGHARW